MPSGNEIHAKGTVVEIMKHGAYRVQLANGHRCIARASCGLTWLNSATHSSRVINRSQRRSRFRTSC